MLSSFTTTNLKNFKKAGGLAVKSENLITAGFSSSLMLSIQNKLTENAPRKNEVSGFGFWNIYLD